MNNKIILVYDLKQNKQIQEIQKSNNPGIARIII